SRYPGISLLALRLAGLQFCATHSRGFIRTVARIRRKPLSGDFPARAALSRATVLRNPLPGLHQNGSPDKA
ncbi:hypothetical protein, partial [Klebsiella aerogenes]|uniref:hypothetical protein n=1 Tax=Klebsiella aerogenes TaxID=548 RepID=UPI001D0D5F8E